MQINCMQWKSESMWFLWVRNKMQRCWGSFVCVIALIPFLGGVGPKPCAFGCFCLDAGVGPVINKVKISVLDGLWYQKPALLDVSYWLLAILAVPVLIL